MDAHRGLLHYRIAQDGWFLFGKDGIAVAEGDALGTVTHTLPQASLAEDGDILIAWDETASPDDYADKVHVARYTLQGEQRFAPVSLTPQDGAKFVHGPAVLPSGKGAIVVWFNIHEEHGAAGWDADLLAIKLDETGKPAWARPTKIVDNKTMPPGQQAGWWARPDGEGGLYMAWPEPSTEVENAVITRVQHLDSDGKATMAAGGVDVTDIPRIQMQSEVVDLVPQTGSYALLWRGFVKNDDGSVTCYLYAQLFERDGKAPWGKTGLDLGKLIGGEEAPACFAPAELRAHDDRIAYFLADAKSDTEVAYWGGVLAPDGKSVAPPAAVTEPLAASKQEIFTPHGPDGYRLVRMDSRKFGLGSDTLADRFIRLP